MIAGVVLHVVFSTILAFIFSLIAGGLNPMIAGASLLLGTLSAIWSSRYFKQTVPFPKKKEIKAYEIPFLIILFIIGFRHFSRLFFPAYKGWRFILTNNLGDLALHIHFIKRFVAGISFPIDSPFWGFDKLRYPFGIDFYNSLWEALGVPMTSHLFFTGFALFICSIVILRWWGGSLMVGAYFFNGGIMGWLALVTLKLKDYQYDIPWKNFFNTIFLTQRGFLIALPLGVYLIKKGLDHFRGDNKLDLKQMLFLGVLWGIMPIFHMHTFIMISALWFLLALMYFKPKSFLYLLIPALPIGTAFVLYLTNVFHSASMINFHPGWMIDPKNPVLFLLQNYGPWLFFIGGMAAYGLIRKAGNHKKEWIIGLVLLVILHIVSLAPWEWDNIKALLWVYLFLAYLSAVELRSLISWLKEKYKEAKWLRLIPLFRFFLLLILFSSGIISLLATIYPKTNTYEMFSRAEIARTEGAVQGISKTSTWITAPKFNHELAFLGHKLVMGYPGHVWSHGYKEGNMVEQKIKSIYEGKPGWQNKAKELGATHIFFGPHEKKHFKVNDPIWRRDLKNISRVDNYEVYALDF